MNQPLRSRLKVAASAFASNVVNDNLRRAQLSYFAAWTAEWAFTVALDIVAYRDSDRFLPVVTGFPPSSREARAEVEEMLDRFSPGESDDDQDRLGD